MQLAHRAALGGAQLDEIDPRINIKGIEGSGGKETVTAVAAGAGDGTRITGKRRESVEVLIRFSLNIRRDVMEEREAVLEAINAWAAKMGWLTVNYKPGRRLYVDDVQLPGEGDMWKRMNDFVITLRARAVPYWQEDPAASAATGIGSSGSGVIAVAGSAKTMAEAVLENRSGAVINTASITIGGKTMAFEGLGLGGSESLAITHSIVQGKYVIRIRIGSRSVMEKRTAESADDFEVAPGDNAFSFSAQRACRLSVNVRGRFA